MVLEKTFESPLDSKEIQPVNPKVNQPWIFIERIDAEASAPILWPPDVKSWLFGKDPKADKDWGQEDKRMTEDEIVGWHHQFNGQWTVAHQAPPSIGFSRQEYWNGLPFPSPGDLPNPGIKPTSPTLQADTLNSEPPVKPGGKEDDRGWDSWMVSLIQWPLVWANSGRWWRTESWHASVHGVAKSWTCLKDWTTTARHYFIILKICV